MRFAPVAACLLLVPLASDAKPVTPSSKTTTAPSTAEQNVVAPMPKALAPATRLKRINAILAKLGRAKVSVLANVDQLTPRNPELADGAKIAFASRISYEGPSDGAKGGVFWLHYDSPMDYSRLDIVWPTKPGHLYAIDCTANVQYYGGQGLETRPAKLLFDVDDVSRVEQPGVGGHVVHAFVAVTESTMVNIEAREQEELPDTQRLAWYGCELIDVG